MPDKDEIIASAARLIAGCGHLVVSTGAGMSRESGIPTFRDAPDSLWADFDPEKLATREGFLADPELVWKWYEERRKMIGSAGPHAGHYAVARLEELVDSFDLVTQNIDDLHRKAGSRNIIELHGNIFRYKCLDEEHPISEPPSDGCIPPLCHCGSMIRPDVVWFGEPLPEKSILRAYRAVESCDVMLVVGTSGMVYPAASLPSLAKSAGASVIEINPQPSEITPAADLFIRARAGEALPELVEKIEEIKAESGEDR